jgi:hypothetical protein
MYPRIAWLVRQRPWRMIRCSATPARAAVVAKPERSECPLNLDPPLFFVGRRSCDGSVMDLR